MVSFPQRNSIKSIQEAISASWRPIISETDLLPFVLGVSLDSMGLLSQENRQPMAWSNCSLRSQAPFTPPTIINIVNFDFNKLWIFITLCHPRVQQALTSGIKFPTNANPAISVQMQTQIQIVQIPVRCKHKKQAGDLPQREGLVFSQIQIPSANKLRVK